MKLNLNLCRSRYGIAFPRDFIHTGLKFYTNGRFLWLVICIRAQAAVVLISMSLSGGLLSSAGFVKLSSRRTVQPIRVILDVLVNRQYKHQLNVQTTLRGGFSIRVYLNRIDSCRGFPVQNKQPVLRKPQLWF